MNFFALQSAADASVTLGPRGADQVAMSLWLKGQTRSSVPRDSSVPKSEHSSSSATAIPFVQTEVQETRAAQQ